MLSLYLAGLIVAIGIAAVYKILTSRSGSLSYGKAKVQWGR
ncbi:hypothetical protein [Erysipelothrix tonsillarum]|nr:hypothetical protein [Erysipelothrix tonsillarum]